MKRIIVSMVIAIMLVSTAPAEALTLRQRADQVMFGNNGNFIKARDNTRKSSLDLRFNWSSDDCSVPKAVKFVVPETGIGSLVFSNQCKQHDFGWRNYGNGLRLSRTASTKLSIDSHFGGLMRDRCGAWWIRASGQQAPCKTTAAAFQVAVTIAPW